jgi:hypothetical protein
MANAEPTGWTALSVVIAFAIALTLMGVAIYLTHLGIWPAIEFSQMGFGALSGAAYLAWRHPESRILAVVVFLPVCVFILVVFGSAIGLPIERMFR